MTSLETSVQPEENTQLETPLVETHLDPSLGKWFTLEEAAQATGVSESTMRRRCKDGTFAHSTRKYEGEEPNNPWLVPLADLLGAGFTVNGPLGDEEASGVVIDLRDDSNPQTARQLALKLQQTELELNLAQKHGIRVEGERDTWRAVAQERDRSLTNIERVINALPVGEQPPMPVPFAGTPAGASPRAAEPVTPSPLAQPRRGWKFWRHSGG